MRDSIANGCFSGSGTVLLSDTAISPAAVLEGMDPVTLAEAMNATFRTQIELIEESNGLVIRSIGNATLAVWGPNHVSPSHVDLVFACARKILEQNRETQAAGRIASSLQIVLATGSMAVTMIQGRLQVYGQPVTQAQQLDKLRIPDRSRMIFTSEVLERLSQKVAATNVGYLEVTEGNRIAVFELTV